MKSITKPAPGNHEYQTRARPATTTTSARQPAIRRRATTATTSARWHLDRAELELLGGRRLRRRLAAGAVAARATSPPIRRRARSPTGTTRASRPASHGSDSTYSAFWQALYDAGADVVLVGHDHDYERFAPQTPSGDRSILARGLREFVVGTGGKEVRPFSTSGANSEARDATSLGVLELTLGAGAYAWRFRPAVGLVHGQRRRHAATDRQRGPGTPLNS